MSLFLPPPVDHSRIHLQLGSNDYINASLISMEEAQRSYILTQVRRQGRAVGLRQIDRWHLITVNTLISLRRNVSNEVRRDMVLTRYILTF